MLYVKVVTENGVEEFFEAEYITYLPKTAEGSAEIVIQRDGVDRHRCECEVFVMSNTGQTIDRYLV